MTTTIKHPDHARRHAGAMDDTAPPDPEVPERSLGRRQFSAKYKAKVLAEYDTLPRSARGALLRREGLYSSLIVTWRRQRDEGQTRPWPSRPDAKRPIRVIVRSSGSNGRSIAWATSSTSPDRSSRSRKNFPRCWSNSPRTAQRRTASPDDRRGHRPAHPDCGEDRRVGDRGGGPGHLVSPPSKEPGPGATATRRRAPAPGPERGRAQGGQKNARVRRVRRRGPGHGLLCQPPLPQNRSRTTWQSAT